MLKKIFPVLLIALLVILGLSGESACYRRQKQIAQKKRNSSGSCPVEPSCGKPCLIPSPEVLPPHQGPAPVLTVPPEYENKCRETQPDLNANPQPPCETTDGSAGKRGRQIRKLRKLATISAPTVEALAPEKIEEAQEIKAKEPVALETHKKPSLTVSTKLSSNYPVEEEEAHNEALLCMVRSGNLSAVRSFAHNGLSNKDRQEAFLAAAESGKDEMITELCEEIPMSTYLDALEIATEQGHLKAVQALLSLADFTIDETIRGQVVVKAVESGQYRLQEKARGAIVAELLRPKSKISQLHRGKAVIYAAQNDYPNIVRKLLNDGAISHNDYVEALDIASKKGNNTVVAELLKNPSQ